LFDGSVSLGKTILVVEDNADAGEMLSVMLGFSVITAEDGQQALDLVQSEPPDLIITDINMPKVDGIEMIKRLREQLRTMPIVVMSAFGSGAINEALDAGANQSTPKPMQVDSLLNVVKQLLT
jgi:CheY-like chemotaxis protein